MGLAWCIVLSQLAAAAGSPPDAGSRDAGVARQTRAAARSRPTPTDGGPADGGSRGVGADGGSLAAPPSSTGTLPMTPEVHQLVERMQRFYETTQDFSARFRQDYFYKTFQRTQTSTGKVTYRKPALMRWEYEKPSPRTFVLAGDRVYAYDPEAKLLTRASIATNTLSASVTFLWGQGRLADEFNIASKACDRCSGRLLELTPRVPDVRFRQVLLEVDTRTAQVLRSTVVDPDGSENSITFLDLATNTGIDEKSFKLSPPPGTQVQDFTGGVGTQPHDGGAKRTPDGR